MQPPPAPRVKSKMDSLIFMPDSITTAKVEEHVSMERKSSSASRAHNGKKDKETTENEVEDVVEVENVERPVDLYKVLPSSLYILQLLQLLIFSVEFISVGLPINKRLFCRPFFLMIQMKKRKITNPIKWRIRKRRSKLQTQLLIV